jgi:hypothetical protein
MQQQALQQQAQDLKQLLPHSLSFEKKPQSAAAIRHDAQRRAYGWPPPGAHTGCCHDLGPASAMPSRFPTLVLSATVGKFPEFFSL